MKSFLNERKAINEAFVCFLRRRKGGEVKVIELLSQYLDYDFIRNSYLAD